MAMVRKLAVPLFVMVKMVKHQVLLLNLVRTRKVNQDTGSLSRMVKVKKQTVSLSVIVDVLRKRIQNHNHNRIRNHNHNQIRNHNHNQIRNHNHNRNQNFHLNQSKTKLSQSTSLEMVSLKKNYQTLVQRNFHSYHLLHLLD